MKLDLTKNLKQIGYDFIDSPIRNQRLLQLWNLRNINPVDPEANSILDVFRSDYPLEEKAKRSDVLDAISIRKDEFNSNLGASVLDQLLKAFKLNKMDLSVNLKIAKKISVGFSGAYAIEYNRYDIVSYLTDESIDFSDNIPDFYKQLKRDNFYLITGVIYAKNLEVSIETESDISVQIEASLNKLIDGKMELSKINERQLTMRSRSEDDTPVAVRVHRLRYHGEYFKRLDLVSDNMNCF